MPDSVVVTGGAGFIGSHIVEELLRAGHRVIAVDDLSSGRPENLPDGARLERISILDRGRLAALFDEARPRWVVHEAAQISVSRSVADPVSDAEVNVLGLLNVLQECVRTGVERVCFASSGGVMYGEVTEPAPEEAPAFPISPYGISKLAGERYLAFFARQHGLEAVALRYSNVYGPRQDPHGEAGVVAIFLKRWLAGKEAVIFGDGGNVRDYVYVEDVAQANRLALSLPSERLFLCAEEAGVPFAVFNIGTGIGTTVNDLERRLRSELEAALERGPAGGREQGRGSGRVLPPPTYAAPRPGDLRSSLVNSERARRVLGWEARSPLQEGLAMTARWFREQADREQAAGRSIR